MASRDEWGGLCRTFGAAVRARREALDLTQEKLGFRAGGLDRTYVSGIERGVRNPTLKIVGRLAKALATHPAKLLEVRGVAIFDGACSVLFDGWEGSAGCFPFPFPPWA